MTEKRAPTFLIQRESLCRQWCGALAALRRPARSTQLGQNCKPCFGLVQGNGHVPKRALFSSALLHFSVALFLIRVPYLLFPDNSPAATLRDHALKINYYALKILRFPRSLQTIRSPGPGGRPGHGHRPHLLPAAGSSVHHPRLTIVLNLAHPENNRQTILQPSSPPEMKITAGLRIPDVLTNDPLLAPKQRIAFQPNASVAKPVKRKNPSVPAAPAIPTPPAELTLAEMTKQNSQPRLPFPPPTSLSAPTAKSGNISASVGSSATENNAGDADGLLVLSVDPATAAQLLALPPGNRYASFSISPAGAEPGAPGGVRGGDPHGGSGGLGVGGDGSAGAGGEGSGGGGGGKGSPGGGLSIAGSGGTGGVLNLGNPSGRSLSSPSAMSLVFPVLSTPRLRKNNYLVFTGPVGGGGLHIYGVLRGGKIYTIFLPMPGKNWVLEYCLSHAAVPEPGAESGQPVVHLGQGLVPPSAIESYDFKQLPLPEDRANKTIILQGLIREDGTVGDLKVYQGIQSDIDAAALDAFGRWKFNPALRGGKPVPVDILVGIPAVRHES